MAKNTWKRIWLGPLGTRAQMSQRELRSRDRRRPTIPDQPPVRRDKGEDDRDG